MDGQRSDLWVVRIGDSPCGTAGGSLRFIDAIKAQLGEARTKQITEDDLELYPTGITFPETALNTEVYRQYNMPVVMPGGEQDVRGVRMSFRVEVPKRRQMPKFVQILQCWRDLPRIGRGLATGGVDIPNLASPSTQPQFRFNVTVNFLAGADRMAEKDVFGNTALDTTQLPLRDSFNVVLRKAWCASVLLNDVSYESTKFLEVTAQIYPEYIDATAATFSAAAQDDTLAYTLLKP